MRTTKKIKQLLLVTLLSFSCGISFSQSVDSLSVDPNPITNSTIIHFYILQSDTITLRVLNSWGLTVMTLIQSTILPSGSYNINLPGDSLAVGVYFILLEIGSKKSLHKFVVKYPSTAGITDKKAIDNMLIFPNPTNEFITIPIAGYKTIIVTDINGKIIKSITTDQQTISLLDIAAGQYFITVSTNQNEKTTTQLILKRE